MTEQKIHNFSPETGKPNPISLTTWHDMGPVEQKQFQKSLSVAEWTKFILAESVAFSKLPKAEQIKLTKASIKAFEESKEKTLGDKLELRLAKITLKFMERPSKFRAFLRRNFVEPKSPYLISV